MCFHDKKWHSLLWGSLLVVLGLIILYGNLGFFDSEKWDLVPVFWPIILILSGIGMIVIHINRMKLHDSRIRRNKLHGVDEPDSGIGRRHHSPFGGFVLIALGAAFLLDDLVEDTSIFLPVFFIGLGLSFFLKYKLFSGAGK